MAQIKLSKVIASLTIGGAMILNDKYIVRGRDVTKRMILHESQIDGKDVVIEVADEKDVTAGSGFIHATFVSVPKANIDDLELATAFYSGMEKLQNIRSARRNNQRRPAARQVEENNDQDVEQPAEATAKAETGSEPEM